MFIRRELALCRRWVRPEADAVRPPVSRAVAVKGVSWLAIAAGWPVLGLLRWVLATSRSSRDVYERRHPLCHHIAGVYIAYCVALIRMR